MILSKLCTNSETQPHSLRAYMLSYWLVYSARAFVRALNFFFLFWFRVSCQLLLHLYAYTLRRTLDIFKMAYPYIQLYVTQESAQSRIHRSHRILMFSPQSMRPERVTQPAVAQVPSYHLQCHGTHNKPHRRLILASLR